jgi:hypothetical protein
MVRWRWLLVCVASFWMAAQGSVVANAQGRPERSLEISTLHGFTLILPEDDDDNITAVLTPLPPVIRMSFRTSSRITADLGFSALTLSVEDDDFTVVNLEGGVSFLTRHEPSGTVPFIGAMVGMVSFSSEDDSESDFYVGAQAGIRHHFRDYAATRVQVGFRHLTGEEIGADFLEVVGGLSFFL